MPKVPGGSSGPHRRGRRQGTRRVAVHDAAAVIAHIQQLEQIGRLRPRTVFDAVGQVAGNMLQVWNDSPVVLRADWDFAQALLASDTDVELVPSWLQRMPFRALAYSLSEPLVIYDGEVLCRYTGFIATGITSRQVAPRTGDFGNMWTTYGPLAKGQGIRCLWAYTNDGDPSPRGQTVSCVLTGDMGHQVTLAQLVEEQRYVLEAEGRAWGDELETLVPLSIQLLLYLAAVEPDLDWLAPEAIARPQQLQRAQIADVGWRIGSAARNWRQEATPTSDSTDRTGGWRMPPHIRKAHWQRVRIATRNDEGVIVGDRLGEQGVDWEYQMRWYPPTPVNATADGVDPAVREIH